MAEPVQDQAARFRALDHTQSFIVQAPAGSGKTELLIQRFLTLLGRVDQPEAVVAITFTRKAAAEMRHRVIRALQNASEPEPESSHEQYTWKLAREALARNDKLNWRLTQHPSRLRIQTIDSLCSTLVRQMPWVSRMGAPPQPEGDVAHLYQQAARETLEMLDSDETRTAVSEAISRLLSHLDNNVGTVEKLVSTMLGSRDQWLRHVVGNLGSTSLRGEIESALGEVIEGELGQLASEFPNDQVAETVELARFAARNLASEGGSSVLGACAELRELPGVTLDSLPHWLGLTELFLTAKGTRRLQLNKNQGFPATDEGRAAKARLKAIGLDPQVEARLHALRSLPPTRFREAQWDMLSALMLLLPVAVGQLRLVFQKEGRVDFTEISIGARTALGSDANPTDLAFALDCRIQHLLIDEFQDTSQSQYELLTRLTGEWQPDDGRTLFLVGDPMQSIYGFRQAEVGLFLRARGDGIAAIGLTPLTLSVNFRSSAGIVNWVNRALSEAFPETEDTLTGAVTYEPSVPFKTEADEKAVTIYPFLVRAPEPEAERVLEIITDSQSTNPGETIAVLVRARSHLFSIVSALRRGGIKFRAVEIDTLGERPVVQDLLALTHALMHPGDRVAWLSILRSPWCGLTLADLKALVHNDFSSAVWDLIQDPTSQDRLSPDGRVCLVRVITVLSDAFPQRGTLPVRRWVERAWIALGGPACLESRTELEDAFAYLDLLEQSLEGVDFRDERKFAEAVGRLFARPDVEAGEELQLLTIHKAKGLEFDTVILPGLGRPTPPDLPKLLMSLEYMDTGQPRLLLAPIHEVGGDKDSMYDYLRNIHAVKQSHESTRLLYVAATRARKYLHLLGHVRLDGDGASLKAPDSRALLGKIWATVEAEFADELKRRGILDVQENAGKGEPRGIPLRRLRADWEPITPPEDIAWKAAESPADSDEVEVHQPHFEWASELQRRVGTVVHRMLQEIRVPDRLDVSDGTIRVALRSEGLDGGKLDEAVSRAVSGLQNAVRDDRGRWILSRHEDDEREYALSAVVEGKVRRFVLDRTFVDDGTRWIIDYKTGSHAGGGRDEFLDHEQVRYRAQLESYAGVMRSVDSRPIRLGLYFPMLQGWREWPFEDAPV
jgi:ATP-dependent exoDNAse (exonuclease V) beta subunit